MIVSELKLYDFRQFHTEEGVPGLSVSFHKGLKKPVQLIALLIIMRNKNIPKAL